MPPEELNQIQHLRNGELVCAMLSIFSRPEQDLTPGFTQNFNFSVN